MNRFLSSRLWRRVASLFVFSAALALGAPIFAQGHGGHGGHGGHSGGGHSGGGYSGGGHMGSSHHSTHHHSGVGIGYGGFGYGGFGYGGIGYGGFGYSGFGMSSGPYGYGYGFGSPYGYPYGSIRIPAYSYSAPRYYSRPGYYAPSSPSVVVSRPAPNVWDGVSDLRPGMVLPDGAVVVSVGPSVPVDKSATKPAAGK